MVIGAIPGEKRMVPKSMLSWLQRICCRFFGIPIHLCVRFVATPLWRFRFFVVLLNIPSQFACVCGSFDELNVLYVLISARSVRVQYVVREGYLTTD
jgi:hypothetical protein